MDPSLRTVDLNAITDPGTYLDLDHGTSTDLKPLLVLEIFQKSNQI